MLYLYYSPSGDALCSLRIDGNGSLNATDANQPPRAILHVIISIIVSSTCTILTLVSLHWRVCLLSPEHVDPERSMMELLLVQPVAFESMKVQQ